MQERIEGLFEQQGFTLQQWVVLMYLRDGLGAHDRRHLSWTCITTAAR